MINVRDIKASKLTVFCAIFFAIMLVTCVLIPDTVSASVLQYTRVTSLAGYAKLTYGRYWNEANGGSTFKQGYQINAGGFYIDPRLMKFRLTLDAQHNSNRVSFSNGYAGSPWREDGEQWKIGTSLSLIFFDRLNRSRGLKLWRYVPSPLNLGYRFTVADNYIQHGYHLGFSYMRPGHIRFFGPRGIIYYDESNGKIKAGKNRYRKKFNDETRNWNRNGNGNWNRNGNGNWNRNGNGNWNRNGNGNWNRNGNGNWNGNSNSGNTNTNGNWNANARSGNAVRRPVKLRTPLGFMFPRIYYNLNGTNVKYDDRADESNSLVSSFRAHTGSRRGGRSGKKVYSSDYDFTHYYLENERNTETRINFTADNSWSRLSMYNMIEKEEDNETEEIRAESTLSWADKYGKHITYNLNARGNYYDVEGNTSTTYGVSGRSVANYAKAVVLAPNLKSISSVTGSVNLTSAMVEGEETRTSDSWQVRVSERIESKQLKKVIMHAMGTSGYNARGVPLTLSTGANSRNLKKLQVNAVYSYNTFYHHAGGSSRSTHSVNLGAKYKFRYNLHGKLEVKRSQSGVEDEFGETQESSVLQWNTEIFWRPTHRSTLKVKFNNFEASNPDRESHKLASVYKRRVKRSGNLTASMDWGWRADIGEKTETAHLSFSWKYRKLTLSSSYTRIVEPNGSANNRLFLSAGRSFKRI